MNDWGYTKLFNTIKNNKELLNISWFEIVYRLWKKNGKYDVLSRVETEKKNSEDFDNNSPLIPDHVAGFKKTIIQFKNDSKKNRSKNISGNVKACKFCATCKNDSYKEYGTSVKIPIS
ncbi:hypothetical protein H8356DRAFT_1275061 [Neocallimastix lanati (nom. inval.)]|uniref:Uncharacterized protein n=1 Tax=Neocallimastix californiae TaxID=1754190 RepID=A0A1Y2BI26_9FUNG|nr:hypothetical protein H8356DRAFT_1275061 [Neocallimastix sp. JGI-2020a]ORY34433.1 hypothetical protein LY90DRAFT_511825 [Neocallimastix californiae]|eukprot:ORY34433.1 hypothetical protein LY90DRAFT_511825 [Neocallimastix californiae]